MQLKKCPMCGGEATIYNALPTNSAPYYFLSCYIGCSDCMFRSREVTAPILYYDEIENIKIEKNKEVVDKWNKLIERINLKNADSK